MLLCASTERTTLAAPEKFRVSQTKDAERRDNMSVRTGKVTQAGQAA